MLKEVALTSSEVRALQLHYILQFFNKLHLNTCNQSKTPQTSDSGREGGEGACACAHMAGGTMGGTLMYLLHSRPILALQRKL